MADPRIQNFHVHIYFDESEVSQAKALAAAVADHFPVEVGHFHLGPVGPHPRGSVQLTISPDLFGAAADWLVFNRMGLTIFAHASTGDDPIDHTAHVVWFGPSEMLDFSALDPSPGAVGP